MKRHQSITGPLAVTEMCTAPFARWNTAKLYIYIYILYFLEEIY